MPTRAPSTAQAGKRPPLRKIPARAGGLTYAQGRPLGVYAPSTPANGPGKPASSSTSPSSPTSATSSTSSPSTTSTTTTTPTSSPAGPSTSTATPPPGGQSTPATARGGKTWASRPGQALGAAVVGLFAWGYALNWFRGGQAQANGWLAAKFLNEPYTAAASSASSASSPPQQSAARRGGRIVTPGTTQP